MFCAVSAAQEYTPGPDSQRKEGVPRGTVTRATWTSRIYPGTVRDYWVYAPAQYQPSKPACVMVFQDGGAFIKEDRVPIVFDNLIQSGAMPITIGIFINPGTPPVVSSRHQPRWNRSYEYDAVGDRYARFLIEEMLPEVGKRYNLSSDPNDRGIAGVSSGGIAAFTAAFKRPDAFRRVMSFIGSFANLRGGDIYPALIRKMEPLPLRVFLQDGTNDLNLYGGNWYLANQEIASSLDLAGYDYKFVTGSGGHDTRHAFAILPDALRWLWEGYPKPVRRSTEAHGGTMTVERHFITQILDPDSDWEPVTTGHKLTAGLAVNKDGDVYFADPVESRIYRIDESGRTSVFRDNTGNATGLMSGADGRLYAAQKGRRRIVAYSPEAKESVIADGVNPEDLAISSRGEVYFTDPGAHRIWFIDSKGNRRVVYEGRIVAPSGIRVSPDESALMVADNGSRWVWSFQIQPDGSLINGEPYHYLELPDDAEDGPIRSGASGLAMDADGFLYTATKLGIQINDPPGKMVGIIRKPTAAGPAGVVFAGKDLHTLYVSSGDTVFRRRLRSHGVLPWTPIQLPVPEL
jgi:enterochelin esterase-like enzyme/sugar lactone lactonase YvrE